MSDCKSEVSREEHLCWTSSPLNESANLTLQSLASFEINYLKISCTAQQEESAELNPVSAQKNAFTVLMTKERGISVL